MAAATDSAEPRNNEAPPRASAPRPRAPHHLIAYGLSLPERCGRQLAALVGRILKPATFVVPRPLRESKFFMPLAPGASAELHCELDAARCSFDIRSESASIARGVLEWTS